MATVNAAESGSHLLALPAELRNAIYTLTLSTPDPVNIVCSPAEHDHQGLIEAALLQTCSQIRNEAAEIFYSTNTFCIDGDSASLSTGGRWLNKLPASSASLVPKLIVSLPTLFTPSAFEAHPVGFPIPKPTGRLHHSDYTITGGYERDVLRCGRHDARKLVGALERSREKGGLRATAVEVVKKGSRGSDEDGNDVEEFYWYRIAKSVRKWKKKFQKRELRRNTPQRKFKGEMRTRRRVAKPGQRL